MRAVREAIHRERIRRLSPAKIDAREKRQREIARYRASKKMARAGDRIGRRGREDEKGAPPSQERVSEVLRIFRREYEAMSEVEREQFLELIRHYVARRMKQDEWIAVARAVKARFLAMLPVSQPPGSGRLRDKGGGAPAGW
jgi:hypothetical protein